MALAAVWALRGLATAAVFVVVRRGGPNAAELAARTRTWWWIVALVSVALLAGPTATAILFAVASFLSFREYLSIVPVRRVDRMAILLAYLAIPLQYVLVDDGWYGLFAIFIPVYMTAAIAIRLALAGETKGFIRSAGTLQWGLFLTVYNLSHLAFLTRLETAVALPAGGAGLLLFVLVVVQLNDVAQYVWGKLFGRHKIAPLLSPSKTIEGFVGGVASATALGAAIWWITPFNPWQAALIALAVNLMGFIGGLVMSAIKRDRGVKDWGAMIEGHGGMLDRVDSVCFSAPVFFHVVRYWFTP